MTRPERLTRKRKEALIRLARIVLDEADNIENAYGWMYSEGAGDDMPEELKEAIKAVGEHGPW